MSGAVREPGRAPLRVRELLAREAPGGDVTLRGWLKTARHGKGVSFLELSDGSSLAGIQVVADPSLPGYDPDVLAALDKLGDARTSMVIEEVAVGALADGMFLADDVVTSEGLLLVCEGQETTRSVRAHLGNFARNGQLPVKLRVTIPVSTPERLAS